MPRIGQLLNRYDVVLLQESWQTPTPNPYWPVRFYHELLVGASRHPYKTKPEPLPLGGDPRRPSAWVSDGLHVFSRYPFASLVRQQWPTCVDTFNDCRALKGFSMARMQLAQGASIDVYNLHMEAGRSNEDHAARAAAIEQLIAFATKHSADHPMIIGGDFNLRTLSGPGTRQWKRLLHGLGLQDACAALSCAQPGRVDRFVFRSGPALRLTARSWASDGDVFVDEQGNPLSDHEPIVVRFAWSLP
jgi:endonuclease/exonuclease/phosphatase family metal-dependent hydrolase